MFLLHIVVISRTKNGDEEHYNKIGDNKRKELKDMVEEDSLSHVLDSLSKNMTEEQLEEGMDIDKVYWDNI